MNIGKAIKNYILWTYERGSMHYDIMVTFILAFIFITPRYVNFKDKPAVHVSHLSQVIITADGQNNFVYEISADQVQPVQDSEMTAELAHVLEPVAGQVVIRRYEPLRDNKGKLRAYRAWGHRP